MHLATTLRPRPRDSFQKIHVASPDEHRTKSQRSPAPLPLGDPGLASPLPSACIGARRPLGGRCAGVCTASLHTGGGKPTSLSTCLSLHLGIELYGSTYHLPYGSSMDTFEVRQSIAVAAEDPCPLIPMSIRGGWQACLPHFGICGVARRQPSQTKYLLGTT